MSQHYLSCGLCSRKKHECCELSYQAVLTNLTHAWLTSNSKITGEHLTDRTSNCARTIVLLRQQPSGIVTFLMNALVLWDVKHFWLGTVTEGRLLTLKMEALQSFETSKTTRPTTTASQFITLQYFISLDHTFLFFIQMCWLRFRWPCGLRLKHAAVRILGLWVRIPQGARISVCCECCVLSGSGLCDRPISLADEFYRESDGERERERERERETERERWCVSPSAIRCNSILIR